MRKIFLATIGGLVLNVIFLASPAPAATEWTNVSFTPEMRYAAVDGDMDSFQAHHWLNSGMDGGLREFTATSDDIGDEYTLYSEGRLLPANGEYYFETEIEKEDASYLHLDYHQFRKYYESEGGVYHRFDAPYANIDSGRDLFLDIGKLGIEYGLTPEDKPKVAFIYEFEFKKGAKSRLTWYDVTQGAVVRKIAPSWQEIDEDVHVFEIKASDNFHGTNWKFEQFWEHAESRNLRNETAYSNTTTASDRKIREQIQQPESEVIATTFELDRWLIKDKLFGTAAYRYGQVEVKEIEDIFEMNANRDFVNFANAESVRGAVGTGQLQTHTGVLSGHWVVNKDLSTTLKFKGEDVNRDGSSDHPMDRATPAPDQVIDQNDFSTIEDDAYRFGEGFSIRYTGIPRLALYNELEFEQIRNNLLEDRASGSSGEVFSRQTITRSYRGGNAVGFNYYPNEIITLTGQYRHHQDNVDYDDQRETDPAGTGAKSAFVDRFFSKTDEFSWRVKWALLDWLKPVFRYRFQLKEHTVGYEANPLDLDSESVSNIYTVDVPLQLTPQLSMGASFTAQDAWVRTPAAESTTLTYPEWNSDVNSVVFTTDYAVCSAATVHGLFQYQVADNYNDFTDIAMAYGADFEEYHAEVGVEWKVRKDLTVEPKYGYYQYRSGDNTSDTNYDAHVAWLGVKLDWA